MCQFVHPRQASTSDPRHVLFLFPTRTFRYLTHAQTMLSRSSISVSRVPLVVSPRQVGVVSCPNSDLISAHLRIFAHQTPPMAMAIPWNGCIANVNIVRRRDGGKGMRTHNPGQPNPIPRGAMSKRRKCSATGRKKSTTMAGTLPN